jgi:GTP-binding protein EngB required for normal cell division
VSRPVDQVLDRLRADARIDASSLAIRIDALNRFRRAAEPYLPSERLRPARAVAVRSGERLALSRAHTVVAVAGATGSGKSSLFNALIGLDLSPVGVKRPTTGQAYACVWGSPAEAAPVLEWLRVPAAHRFARESPLDGDDQAGVRGLILLDLPDFDSVERDHAREVTRLLQLVDLVVWVVDPQKYADQVIHERFLQPFHHHREVSVVALNHTDLLPSSAASQVLADLRRLLAADGLAEVPTIATSAVAGPGGLFELRATLERAVTARRAALQRLAADVDGVVEDLAELVGPPAPEVAVDRLPELVDGLAEAAGVATATDAVAAAYRRRADAVIGWPLLRLLSRSTPPPPEPQPVSVAHRAATNLAVRAVAARAQAGLPEPWSSAVGEASRSRLEQLPAALTAVVSATSEFEETPAPWWWRLVAAAQWLALGAVLVGVCWLVAGWVLRVVALPVDQPQVGWLPVPVLLLLAGLAAGALLAIAVRPVVAAAARRAKLRASGWLRAALVEVGRDYVVAPVREVLHAYEQARAALHAARTR